MPELHTISEKPLSYLETKECIKQIKDRDEDLSTRAKRTFTYLNTFIKLTPKKETELRKKISELQIARLKDHQIVKIADILPTDIDSLKSVLAGENITIKQEDLKKIIDVTKDVI